MTTRIGVTREMVQKIMEKKLNLFGHDRLLKQVVCGIMDGSNRRERQEEDGQMMWKNDVTMIYTHSV